MRIILLGYEIIIKKKKIERGEVMPPYNIYNIVLYIIDRCIKANSPVSNLQIQKILYYVQANFLVNNETPCFKEDILNWRYGPVIEEVYSELREFSSDPIEETPTLMVFSLETFKYEKIELNIEEFKENTKLIDDVVDSYMHMRAFELVKKTHQENPWLETNRNEVIPKELIKNFYSRNRELILNGN